MGTSALFVALIAVTTTGQTLPEEVVKQQEDAFQKWWGTELNWKFDELPREGKVASSRIPYSGYIYPDSAGGTMNSLRKYDRAFNGSRYSATSHERWDTTAYGQTVMVPRRVGLFRTAMTRVTRTPHWHGHCNGWTSASIRHAEPQRSVRASGVVFSPADIKAMLAEIYMYNEMEMLAGIDYRLMPGTLHVVMANWLGRGKHPVAMEADPGKEKWNYPIYAYSTSSARRGNNRVDVKMNIAYAASSRGEYIKSPRIKRVKYFHYYLDLDDEGQIVGGRFYRDSSRIDMLWIPLSPKPPGEEGNKRGNPHVDVDQVLAIWRASVDEATRMNWLVVDPPDADRIANAAELADLVPAGHQPVEVAEATIDVAAATSDAAESGDAVGAGNTEDVQSPANAAESTEESTSASSEPAEVAETGASASTDTATEADAAESNSTATAAGTVPTEAGATPESASATESAESAGEDGTAAVAEPSEAPANAANNGAQPAGTSSDGNSENSPS